MKKLKLNQLYLFCGLDNNDSIMTWNCEPKFVKTFPSYKKYQVGYLETYDFVMILNVDENYDNDGIFKQIVIELISKFGRCYLWLDKQYYSTLKNNYMTLFLER